MYIEHDSTFAISPLATTAAGIGSTSLSIPEARNITYTRTPTISSVRVRQQAVDTPVSTGKVTGTTAFEIPMDDDTRGYALQEEQFLATKGVYRENTTAKRSIATRGMITEAVPFVDEGLDWLRMSIQWTQDRTLGTN